MFVHLSLIPAICQTISYMQSAKDSHVVELAFRVIGPCGYQLGNLAGNLAPRLYKKKFMLNSAEYENLDAHKYKIIKKLSIFQDQLGLICIFPAYKC